MFPFSDIKFKIESTSIKAKTRKLAKIRWIQIRIPIGVSKKGNVIYHYQKFWGGKKQEKVKNYLENKLGSENVKWIKVKLQLEMSQDIVAMHNPDLKDEMVERLKDVR